VLICPLSCDSMPAQGFLSHMAWIYPSFIRHLQGTASSEITDLVESNAVVVRDWPIISIDYRTWAMGQEIVYQRAAQNLVWRLTSVAPGTAEDFKSPTMRTWLRLHTPAN
jgi:hypothetical protein